MPGRRGSRRRARSRLAGKRKVRSRAPSILIIECDPATLESQALSMARDLQGIVRLVVPSATLRLVPAVSRESLLHDLGRCKVECGGFDHVAVVGHSNRNGLRLAPGLLVSWEDFAPWIEPFRPKCAILVACEAGRWLPSEALFSGIASLREIYGSPVITTEAQAGAVKILVPYLLVGNRLPPDILPLQLLNFALTGGIVFRQTKKEFQRAGPLEAAIWTGWEDMLRAALGR